MTTAPVGKQVLLQRLDGLRQIPGIPAVLAPLLRYLQQPVDQLDVLDSYMDEVHSLVRVLYRA
jgi:hypothetical protein